MAGLADPLAENKEQPVGRRMGDVCTLVYQSLLY